MKRQRPPRWLDVLRARYPLVFFLLLYLLFVLFTYRDYGVAWDEYDVYSRGEALFRYFFGKGLDPSYFLTNDGKADGWVLYDYWYPLALSLLNPGFSMEYFHWLNLFFAAVVFIAAYELLYFQYRKPSAALLGPVFLFLMPRFLGHAPFTPRDLGFAVTYFAALAGLFLLRAKPGYWKVPVLGLLFGMAQASRVVGLSLYVIWVLFYFYDWNQDKALWWHKPESRKKHIRFVRDLALTFGVSLAFMAATWPYLAHGFFSHALEVLKAASRFPWTGDFLFMGRMVSATDLPWYYLPVWILISTPLFILFFLAALPWFAGAKSKTAFTAETQRRRVKAEFKPETIKHFFSASLRLCGEIFSGSSLGECFQNRLLVFFSLALAVNLALVFIFKPVVYLGMRHFLYLLPILGLLAALSAVEFWLNFRPKAFFRPVVFLTVLNMLAVGFQLWKLHPYEYVYFNELTGGLKGAYGRYEIEERGTSAKEAVEWLAQNRFTDPDKTYHVSSYQDPFQTLYYLPHNVKYEDSLDKADYLITLPFSGKHRFNNPLLYSVTREGVPLMDIYEKSR